MSFLSPRLSLIGVLVGFLAGCASPTRVACDGFGDPDLQDTGFQDLAVAVVYPSKASLHAIDGHPVPLDLDPKAFVCGEAHLRPGRHTLTLRAETPVSELVEPTGYINLQHRLTFDAESGHTYELNFDRTYERHFRIFWWIENTTRNEVVAGMSLD